VDEDGQDGDMALLSEHGRLAGAPVRPAPDRPLVEAEKACSQRMTDGSPMWIII
jgi:hypothetical protein